MADRRPSGVWSALPFQRGPVGLDTLHLLERRQPGSGEHAEAPGAERAPERGCLDLLVRVRPGGRRATLSGHPGRSVPLAQQFVLRGQVALLRVATEQPARVRVVVLCRGAQSRRLDSHFDAVHQPVVHLQVAVHAGGRADDGRVFDLPAPELLSVAEHRLATGHREVEAEHLDERRNLHRGAAGRLLLDHQLFVLRQRLHVVDVRLRPEPPPGGQLLQQVEHFRLRRDPVDELPTVRLVRVGHDLRRDGRFGLDRRCLGSGLFRLRLGRLLLGHPVLHVSVCPVIVFALLQTLAFGSTVAGPQPAAGRSRLR
jgi:hypothetical protein